MQSSSIDPDPVVLQYFDAYLHSSETIDSACAVLSQQKIIYFCGPAGKSPMTIALWEIDLSPRYSDFSSESVSVLN